MSKGVKFSSVQFDTLLNTRFSEVIGLLEDVGLYATLKLSFAVTVNYRVCSSISEQIYQR